MAVAGPPGAFGDEGRAVEDPVGVFTGEVGRGEDCEYGVSSFGSLLEESGFGVVVRGAGRGLEGRW
jgi:hypothetical protein